MIHFEIMRTKRGRLKRNQWRVVVKADNGETLFWSEGYNNRADALNAEQVLISGVQQGAITEAIDD